jgi:hypothetical protein
MVTEAEIDQYIEQLSVEARLDKEVMTISETQPFLAGFLHVDQHSLLSKEEYSFLWFIVAAVYGSYAKKYGRPETIQASDIEDKEEKIWGLLNDSKEKNFRSKLDVFFEMCPEEDLLAFIEDSLLEDEDSVVTNAGREFIFVPAATFLFCLCL